MKHRAVYILLFVLLTLTSPGTLQGQDPWRSQPAPPLIPRAQLPTLQGPGRARPHRAVPAQAIELLWEGDAGMRTLLIISHVIDPQRSLAHVIIWEQGDQDLRQLFQVGYAAIAFYDHQGMLHIDGRAARLWGPMAHAWWPDSFAGQPDDAHMQILDDAGNRGRARVIASWSAQKDDQAYRLAGSMRDLMLRLYL